MGCCVLWSLRRSRGNRACCNHVPCKPESPHSICPAFGMCSGFIPISKLPELLGRLDAPLGWHHKELRRTERLKFLKLLEIPVPCAFLAIGCARRATVWGAAPLTGKARLVLQVYSGCLCFHDTFLAIVGRVARLPVTDAAVQLQIVRPSECFGPLHARHVSSLLSQSRHVDVAVLSG